MKALIPCAGFGTRMRMAPHQAKELIPDETGAPTIEWSLNICKENNIDPITYLDYLKYLIIKIGVLYVIIFSLKNLKINLKNMIMHMLGEL